jgi:GTP cyclohydrolase II
MRAYQLQADGMDTLDADHSLGFDDDERDYAIAREILVQLGVTHIDLLTNNPAKLKGINRDPIQVGHRSGVYGHLTQENQRYMTTKAERSGHWLDTLLDDPRSLRRRN